MADTETPVKTTIPVQNAAQAAESYLHSLQGFMGGQISDIRLEEVELAEDESYWLITLGFSRPADNQLVPAQVKREYKLFEIDAVTGKVKAMKIRTL